MIVTSEMTEQVSTKRRHRCHCILCELGYESGSTRDWSEANVAAILIYAEVAVCTYVENVRIGVSWPPPLESWFRLRSTTDAAQAEARRGI